MKLNVLLAKTDYSGVLFKKSISDYVQFFNGKQGDFKGVRKTYAAREGTMDEPAMRGSTEVVTTVTEKLDWFQATNKEHIDNLFSLEASNASGNARAELVVEGVSFGVLSSLELLRLKSLIEGNEFEQMYNKIPVRSDAEIWSKSNDDQYSKREVYEGTKQSGVKKSITKEDYIVSDPNIEYLKDTSKYVPQVRTKDTILELGDYTVQHFTGEWSHRQRAELVRRRSTLLTSVIEALKVANDAENVKSAITAYKLFGYLHKGI